MMTTVSNVKETLSILAGIILCLKADDSCAKMDFRLLLSNGFSNRHFHQETTDLKYFCVLVCYRNSSCVGFAYNSVSRLCSLYDIDVKNQGNIITQANTEIFTSHKACGAVPLIGMNTETPPTTNNYPVGHRYNYSCLQGSYSLGSKEARCQRNGTWFIPNVNCRFAKTCYQAQIFGADLSSAVKLKPVSNRPVALFTCEISGSDVFTAAGHNMTNATHISGYEEIRGFHLNLSYQYGIDILAAIADNSAECEQYIKLVCSDSPFYYQGIVVRNGSLATYYAGGRKGENNCACNIDNSCVGNGKCNCDAEGQQVDEGFVKYKEDLPITGFKAGDTGGQNEFLYLTIGKLKCKGETM